MSVHRHRWHLPSHTTLVCVAMVCIVLAAIWLEVRT